MLGERDDVERLYAGMDLFVLASHREGFPRAAMEAAAMGVPDRGDRHPRLPPGGRRRRDRSSRAASATPAHWPPRSRRWPAIRRPGRGWPAAARAKAIREFDQQRVIDITLGVYEELLARG